MRRETAGETSPESRRQSDRAISQRRADAYNREPGTLTGYDCPICLNRGNKWVVRDDGFDNPELVMQDCSCMEIRKSLRRMAESGLQNALSDYTFDRWQVRAPWQQKLLNAARRYADAENPEGWFYVGGRPGSGKTHICTAICGELLRRGVGVRYAVWPDLAVEAKAKVLDAEAYQRIVGPLKRADMLYVDDFFKPAGNGGITPADVKLAHEIINSRYLARKPMIISSERGVKTLLDVDEAMGSRIYERSKGNAWDLSKAENWRLSV